MKTSTLSPQTISFRIPLSVVMLVAAASLACTISTNKSTQSDSSAWDAATPLPTMTPWATLTPVATATADTEAFVVQIEDSSATDLGIVGTGQAANQAEGDRNTNSSANVSNSDVNQQSVTQNVFVVNNQSPAAACGLVPAGNYNVNIRSYGDTSAPVIGTLPAGSWVYALGLYGLWFQVDVPGTPVDEGWVYAKVVGLTEPCTCAPDCEYSEWPQPPVVSPMGTYCQLRNFMAHGVVSEPYGGGQPVYQLGPNTVSNVLARTSDGYVYQIETPAGPGWTGVLENVEILGDCSAIPVLFPPFPEACQLRNFMAQGVMSEPYGQGYPVYQLGPNTVSTVLARTVEGGMYQIDTPTGPGWTNGVENIELIGDCSQISTQDPPPSAPGT